MYAIISCIYIYIHTIALIFAYYINRGSVRKKEHATGYFEEKYI